MADGVTHLTFNVVAGAAVSWLAYRHLQDADAWRYVAVGAAIGSLITPDMDLEGKTHTEALMRRIPGVGFVFQWGWYGYAMAFRHRGYSHSLLWGTPSRVLYSLFLLMVGLVVASGFMWYTGRDPAPMLDAVTGFVAHFRSVWLFAAWWVQDVVHYLLDGMFKG